jgi:hypothetical protein
MTMGRRWMPRSASHGHDACVDGLDVRHSIGHNLTLMNTTSRPIRVHSSSVQKMGALRRHESRPITAARSAASRSGLRDSPAYTGALPEIVE